MKVDSLFPNIITDLPQAEIPIQGLKAYLLQGINHQVVFMSFENDVTVPEHTHEAQWGVVLAGEIELTLNGIKKYIKKVTLTLSRKIFHIVRI